MHAPSQHMNVYKIHHHCPFEWRLSISVTPCCKLWSSREILPPFGILAAEESDYTWSTWLNVRNELPNNLQKIAQSMILGYPRIILRWGVILSFVIFPVQEYRPKDGSRLSWSICSLLYSGNVYHYSVWTDEIQRKFLQIRRTICQILMRFD